MAQKLNWFTAASVFAAAVAGAGVAQAQQGGTQASEGGLDEIIVTAQRRAESVQDVPVPVTAFSPDQLENLNINNALQLAQYVPNLFAMNNTGLGSANAYFLRGLGNTETIATFDPPVGTYVDDVYITRQNANNFAMFDMQRIEVLRGPQGTLFGRNTTGGAVNMILNKPASEFGGFFEFGMGKFDASQGRMSIDLPLSENVRTKFSVYGGNREGYAVNVTNGQRVNGDENYGVRGALAIDFSERLTWDVSLSRLFSDSVNLLNSPCSPAAITVCDGRYVATGLSTGQPNTATGAFNTISFATFAPLPVRGDKARFGLGNETTTNMLISNLEWGLNDNWSVNFITGYTKLTQQFALDFFDGRAGAPGFSYVGATIGTPVTQTFSGAQIRPVLSGNANGNFTITNDGLHETFTQEVKVTGSAFDGRLDLVGGVFYLDELNKTDFADIFGAGLLADRQLRNTTQASAVYLQGDWHLTDQLTATVGVRYTDETKKMGFLDNRPQCAVSQTAAGCISSSNIVNATFANGGRIPVKQSASEVTPRFAVTYKPNDDMMLFASATRGFKSGGWNARGTNVSTLLPFDPELIWSYEAGVKSEWLDGRLRANATYFNATTEDLQTPSAFVNPATGAITFITRNFADLENQGFEFEFSAAPIDGLTLFTNIGLQDSNYSVPKGGPNLDAFGILGTDAQQRECRAALAGQASPGLVGATFSALTPAQRATNTCGVGIVDPQGNISKPVRAPEATVSYGFSYEWDWASAGKLIPSVSAVYYGESEVGTSNVSIFAGPGGTFNTTGQGVFLNGSRSPATTLFNASLAWENADGDVRISLDCNNCTDDIYVQSTLSNFTYINPPRMWMLKLKADF